MKQMTRCHFDFLNEEVKRLRQQLQPGANPADVTGVGQSDLAPPAFMLDPGVGAMEFACCCPVIDRQVLENFGSGVLIADRLVLTASHAVPAESYVRIPSASIAEGRRIDVVRVERLNKQGPGPDLALLLLAEPASVAPARLSSAEADIADAVSKGVTLCGFGFARDAFGNLTGAGVKRERELPRVDTSGLPSNGEAAFDPKTEFMAGGESNGRIYDAEAGDSGGPAFLPGTTTVVGIVSRNAAGHMSVFTKIFAHLDSMRLAAKNLGINLPD